MYTCGRTGLRIVDKSLMHRGNHSDLDAPEEVLIMLECPACKNRSAYWQDGSPWERLTTIYPQCSQAMSESSKQQGEVIITAYKCPMCEHSYQDKLDLSVKEKPQEKPDPNYEKDKARFCLSEKAGKEYLDARHRWESLQKILGEAKEHQDNKDIYDAIHQVQKPKIAELSNILSPVLEKASYIELSLDKPEVGRDVYVGFNCLDSKSDRDDYQSRKTLKKLVDDALEVTNWRLMSDGISYRLGYLNGRLRAYEKEEDLKNLVIKSAKLRAKQKGDKVSKEGNAKSFKTPDGKRVIL